MLPYNPRLSLLLLLSLLPLIHAQCPAGSVLENEQCVLCPPGTFAAKRDKVCQPCKPGTFQPISGAQTPKVCRKCYPNTFSADPAAVSCKQCPRGQISPPGATECLSCPPGSPLSRRRCSPCSNGFYDHNGECRRCPGKLSSPDGATSVEQCVPCRELGNCARCGRNYFHTGLECAQCPPGSRTRREGARRESQCLPCPAGFFLDENDFSTDGCKACPRGTTSSQGASACRNPRKKCPKGRFEDKNKNCMRCGQEFRYVPKKKICVRCPEGYASRGGLTTKCTKCGPMLVPDFGRCSCTEGTFFVNDTTCKPCPPGTSQINTYHTSRRCEKCDPGTFADKPGTISRRSPVFSGCPICPFGLVSLQEGAKKCEKCPDGLVPAFTVGDSFSPFFGSDRCVKPTDGCALGFALKPDVFGRQRCRPVFCPPGTPSSEIGTTCIPCRAGFIQTTEKQTCKRCPRNSVSVGGTQRNCTKCEKGFVQDSSARSKCACKGDFAFGKGIVGELCQKCPPGSYSRDGAGNEDNKCMPCQPGLFNANRGESFCRDCPANTISGEGARECTPCPPGFVTRESGATRCVRF